MGYCPFRPPALLHHGYGEAVSRKAASRTTSQDGKEGTHSAVDLDPRGLFPPSSVTFRIGQEAIIITGGLRALLMQLAHPVVAQGVADHSRFRQDPLGRFRRTLDFVIHLSLGDMQEVHRAVQFFHRAHRKVQGLFAADAGPFTAGQAYSAADPETRFWVLATLWDTTLLMYQRLIRPLSDREKEQFYRENLRIPPLLGIPLRVCPPSYAAFEEYLRGMLNGEVLVVTDLSRELARETLRPAVLHLPRPVTYLPEVFTVGLLPPRLRRDFGFLWNNRRERIFRGICTFLRLMRKGLPSPLRILPAARRARKRWQHPLHHLPD